MRVDVDFNKCQSNGLCVLAAPEVFDLDEDGLLHYDQNPDPLHETAVWDAVRSCPVNAISLVDDR